VTERRSGLALAALGGLGTAIALYLTLTRLAGVLPACGALRGCEDVATSPYSAIGGIPVAAFGVALSATIAALGVAWWRRGRRRALLGAYGLGLAGVFVVGYLTWLELAIIEAVCAWCTAYGLTVVLGWLLTVRLVRVTG
jgi:uncharacterized membrane protein